MYVFEEVVNGRKLTEIINTEHENVKYLPDIKIPSNVVRICFYKCIVWSNCIYHIMNVQADVS